MSQFKITSDGTLEGTLLIGPDGKPIGLCERLIWEADSSTSNNTTKLTVVLYNVPIEVNVATADVTITKKDIDSMLGKISDFEQNTTLN